MQRNWNNYTPTWLEKCFFSVFFFLQCCCIENIFIVLRASSSRIYVIQTGIVLSLKQHVANDSAESCHFQGEIVLPISGNKLLFQCYFPLLWIIFSISHLFFPWLKLSACPIEWRSRKYWLVKSELIFDALWKVHWN